MMKRLWPKNRSFCKTFLALIGAVFFVVPLAGCSTNPATGEQQFAALMSPAQEQQIGAEQHDQITRLYGIAAVDEALESYVQTVGERVAANTERPDVTYTFSILDTPMVNAFALPGGYVYVSRGLMAQANSEAELAAVLAHEVGHITARHSAERYSRSVVTSLGATLIASALDSGAASQALGVGSDLFVKSYSRKQEHESDELGIRYLYRAGYEPMAMSYFLKNLDQYSAFQRRLAGRGEDPPLFTYFSTHPQTTDRVSDTVAIARNYPQDAKVVKRDPYLRMIDGLTYGDSARQGFVRDDAFYHPEMDFTFAIPEGFQVQNQPSQIVVTNDKGAVVVFDAAPNPQQIDPASYLTQIWMKGETLEDVARVTVHGKDAATASFRGTVNKRPVTIRLMAVEWAPNRFFRFQIAIPDRSPARLVESLKTMTYSLRPMTAEEERTIRPYQIQVITADSGDTVDSLARRMPFTSLQAERFRTLNAMDATESVTAGQLYKIIIAP